MGGWDVRIPCKVILASIRNSKMSRIKSTIKRLCPVPLQAVYTRVRVQQIQRQYKLLGRAEAFERIYAQSVWGGEPAKGKINSGTGSTGQFAGQYCRLLKELLSADGIKCLADLGCGNFNIGSFVASMVPQYIGVDIAQSVISHNMRTHANERIRFVRADVTSDPLPVADVALVRQVLQHLSNAEIKTALSNILGTYPVVFITEHVYCGPGSVPNLDIPHGPGTRVPFRSGVFVDRSPFSLQAELVGDIDYAPGEVLRTWVVKNDVKQK